MKARGLLLEGSDAKPSNQPEKPAKESSDTVVPTVREPSSVEKVILPVQTKENLAQASVAQIIDKTVTEEELITDKSDSWFEEEIDEMVNSIGKIDTGRIGQVEVDVSFSDLEEDDDDDDDDLVIKKTVTSKNDDGNSTGSSPESNNSSDWLEVDDLVVD